MNNELRAASVAWLDLADLGSWRDWREALHQGGAAWMSSDAVILRDTSAEFGAALGVAGVVDDVQDVCAWLRSPARVVVAAPDGDVTVAGLTVLLAADIRLVTEGCRIHTASLFDRQVPGVGVSDRMVAVWGANGALARALSPEPITADEAAAVGLADYLVSKQGFDSRVAAIADSLAAMDPEAAAEAKALFNAVADVRQLRAESDAAARLESGPSTD